MRHAGAEGVEVVVVVELVVEKLHDIIATTQERPNLTNPLHTLTIRDIHLTNTRRKHAVNGNNLTNLGLNGDLP